MVICRTCKNPFNIQKTPFDSPDTGFLLVKGMDKLHVVICNACLNEFKRDFGLDVIEQERRRDAEAAERYAHNPKR